jgi:hypothetical protein
MSNDTGQLLLFGFGGMVAILFTWYVFWGSQDAWNKPFRKVAQRTGLVYGQPRVDPTTIGYMRHCLEGMLGPIGITLETFRLANSPRAGIRGFTVLSVRTACQTPGNIVLETDARGRPAQFPLFATGDQRFDYVRQVGSPNPEAARRLLSPHVIAALFNKSGWEAYTIQYESGIVRCRWPEFLWEEKHIDDALRLAQALATVQV